MIKLNLRWLVQALALLAGIACFSTLFDSSKALLHQPTGETIAAVLGWFLLFCLSFFVLLFTSYLKQRANFTLRRRLAGFERLVHLLHLADYRERTDLPEAEARRRPDDSTA
ncbi:MAG: hypothetical protein ONB48_12930 [candidate division KSB1 bacterium]|nr:hypothetical protein [candidate division KSB1 bacterium]MDZ7275000.1 hypothetical protein [candidate division KSB1 bacterium]MDZ7286551.1 hypothetical protein [candidate division KSB1 bacterium]MDZ7299285.1 hypothetical protein [candidate division KSB1 bacterium]MDZ7307376.1 hypothetical protein [candidate division KSB1 bacterium]